MQRCSQEHITGPTGATTTRVDTGGKGVHRQQVLKPTSPSAQASWCRTPGTFAALCISLARATEGTSV